MMCQAEVTAPGSQPAPFFESDTTQPAAAGMFGARPASALRTPAGPEASPQ